MSMLTGVMFPTPGRTKLVLGFKRGRPSKSKGKNWGDEPTGREEFYSPDHPPEIGPTAGPRRSLLHDRNVTEHMLNKALGHQMEKRPFECEACQKRFMKRGHLMTHRFVHLKDSKHLHTCEICNRSFNFRFNLVRHLKMHSGIRPYVCTVCGYAFNLKGNLHIHFRTHTKQKPFPCRVCSKKFTMKQNRDVHEKKHQVSNSSRFWCSKCEKFISKRLEGLHEGENHVEPTSWLCKHCGKIVSSEERKDHRFCGSKKEKDEAKRIHPHPGHSVPPSPALVPPPFPFPL
mmetsp:Transcript_5169/g.12542  ORF Transcript_5169/g.12542 Transcript_5169/m.12542 type:complete len:287 (+) Transcript_5169:379-1239(+)